MYHSSNQLLIVPYIRERGKTMVATKPRVLYVPWDNPVHDEEAWKTLNDNFDLIIYDFDTVEEYMDELRKPGHGRIGYIDAICRSTWLKSNPYIHHYILRDEAVRLLPDSCKLICQSGHGFDIVDVEYLTSRNVVFCNSPDSCTRATADVGVFLILNAFRYLTLAEHCVRTPGKYYDSQEIANIADDPNGKTLGIVGLGDIGILVAKTCQSLGMRVVYHNRKNKNIEGMEYCATVDELFAQADCIFIACPYTPQTHHLVNEESFKKMKPKVRIVNIARGPIVKESAVIDAIERNQLVGAGFDVHEFEPKIDERLLNNWKITLTPHIGVCTRDSFQNFEKKCVKNMMQFFYQQEKPHTAVNPEVYDKLYSK
ncbi:CYFA0S29e00166g1_1 [Cyberlindnera fabianii]|uniref:CYFA0S29e00166g1_1 n=1 Tax=Cyberlindnera fabianii TaxID=36022 RepID=A0A061BAY5_CYBFA|nr:CYFA0S29e00166g1_1 [Cyberlindnera fabianii]